ncbi:MAG: hypothetical protein C5B43_01210 [Verrucomicrobia bacterium]|nr:MAG: hypothetical protein C5B43_01210 [Verrucomicrobiota bacterium]
MKFEEAIEFLRDGKRIYRLSDPDKGSLAGTTNKVFGSFYLTIYDILADDWAYCGIDKFPKL